VSSRLLLFALLLSVLLSACAPVGQKIVGEPVTQAFADGLIREWSEAAAKVTSVQGLAKVKVFTRGKSLNGTQVLLAEKPDSLRAEVLSPFGSPLMLMAAESGEMSVSLPSQNLYYTGAATPDNLALFVNIPLRLTDLVSVLLYQPPLIDAWREDAFSLQEGGWIVVRRGAIRRQELVFNQQRQLVEVSYFKENDLFIKISYSQFPEQGEAFPHSFSIDLPEKQANVSLKFSDLETNGMLQTGVFQLPPPPGAKVVHMPDVFLNY
jgi:outer membrane lipoprotein-sorting protein